MNAHHPREQGAIAIMVAILLVVLMAAVALAVDVGGLYLRRRELVNGSDAAALSAARTCARGPGNDPRFATPEQAADYQVQGNAGITAQEVLGPNITDMTGCGTRYGHVSVQYTSQQALHFAPVLGFSNSSPVTTAATASWGLGSNNPIPMVLSNLFDPGTCQMPPAGAIAIDQTCAFWYDNDALGNGNFTFLSLDPHGWDVTPGAPCSQTGGASLLTKWISGEVPASVTINWTDPTYVCSDSGIKGVGNSPQSQVWNALDDLAQVQAIRDFPINWEGPGQPIPSAPSQGTIYTSSGLDKYDVIGFAAMRVMDVVTPDEATLTPTKTDTCQGRTGSNVTVPTGTYTWNEFGAYVCPVSKLPPSLPVDSVTVDQVDGLSQGPNGYTFTNSDITLNAPLQPQSQVSFTWTIDATYGPCGPPPPGNNSAMCVVMQWRGSTLTDDYQESQDNLTVVRLCDLAYRTCLDQ